MAIRVIDFETLIRLTYYDPETGLLWWRKKWHPLTKADHPMGSVNSCGSRIVRIKHVTYQVHRLIWLYVHGEWPKGDIDHINGNRLDNRLCNLRDVSTRDNCGNQVCHRKGKLVGAKWDKQKKRWLARIKINGKQRYLGSFLTELEAHHCYLASKKKLQSTVSQEISYDRPQH